MRESTQSPQLFTSLLDFLKTVDATPLDFRRFIDRWSGLTVAEAFPCPACYLRGKDQPLSAIYFKGDVLSAICLACEARFDVPTDD